MPRLATALAVFLLGCSRSETPVRENDLAKVVSSLTLIDVTGELLKEESAEWPELETWVVAFGTDRFLQLLPQIKKSHPDLADECAYFTKQFSHED